MTIQKAACSDQFWLMCSHRPVPRQPLSRRWNKLFLNVFISLISIIILPLAVLASSAPESIRGAKTVSADEVIQLALTKSDLVIIDTRQKSDFEAGHIEGSINLLDTNLTAETVLSAKVRAKTTPVLFYCNGPSCGRAAKAVEKAVAWGYSEVYYYASGIQDWKAKNFPLSTRASH